MDASAIPLVGLQRARSISAPARKNARYLGSPPRVQTNTPMSAATTVTSNAWFTLARTIR
jgi:hypothetical protein